MRLKLLFIVLFWHIFAGMPGLFGQTCNGNDPSFTITPAVGCMGKQVSIQNTKPDAKNLQYVYEFDRSRTTPPTKSEETQDPFHTYVKPGDYVILQYGSVDGSGFAGCKDYKVRETGAIKASVVACPNGKAQLILSDDAVSQAFDKIEVDWGDGEKEVWTIDKKLVIPHNYKSGQAKSVVVKGRYNDGSCQTSIVSSTITPTPTTGTSADTRIMSVEMLSDGAARILFEGSANSPTRILMDDGSGTFVDTGKGANISGTQSATIDGLDPKKVYRFKLSSKNICDDEVLSAVVSSVVLEDAGLALDEINSLSWKPYPDASQVIEYQIKRDDAVIASTTSLSYLDKAVKCGTSYKYELVAILQNNGRSYSVPVEIEPKSSAPETITDGVVTVKGSNEIETTVSIGGQGLTSTYDLVVERTIAGSASWSPVSPPNHQSLTYTDTGVNTGATSYCYRFKYVNACKLSSPDFSKPVCSILLTRNVKDIAWTAAAPFTDAVSVYEVLMTDRAGASLGSEAVGLNNSYVVDINNQNTSSFQIEARSGTGMRSVSNPVSFMRDPIILAPDVFTPNGDSHNERFEIKSYFAETFRLSVFNRWGEVVFRTDTANDGWDGYYKGNPAPGGYYLYKVEVTDIQGKKINRDGSFLLIR